MTSRHRTTSSSRKDNYGLWRPSDSNSDRPRQTMASTQRHNVDQAAPSQAPRKHHSSQQVDAVDFIDSSAAHTRPRHKSSSKDRSSTAQPSSYYAVPPSPKPSLQYQTHEAYYDLREYLKKKTDRRSPRSHEKALRDEGKTSRSGQHSSSRNAYQTTAAYVQPTALSQQFEIPSAQATRDPTSSSRHHRDREKDREKSSSRNPEKVKHRDHTTEKSDERERRKRREKVGEKEQSSKDKERHREKDGRKDREGRAAQLDAASVSQAYVPATASAQRSTERNPAPYPENLCIHSTLPQVNAHVPPPTTTTAPWAGLTSAGRGAAASGPDPIYPYASDKDDPPLPIPPPERRRERTSSKPHRSHHQKVAVQQAGQDSGISSSEQEHSVMERPRTVDRHYSSREQASILQRGYSSGPSGSENERAPTIQKERRKHRTHGESSRHKSRSTSVDAQPVGGPTTSQEIANAWYQRHTPTKPSVPVVETAAQKVLNGATASSGPAPPSVHPSGKATSSVGLTTSQRSTPRIVSIRAGQGPADPQPSSTLPKIHSGTTPSRLPDPLPVQYHQRPATRLPDTQQQAASSYPHSAGFGDASSSYHNHPTNAGAAGSYSTQTYQHGALQHMESNGIMLGQTHGHHLTVPDVVVRPPSTAPALLDSYMSRPVTGSAHQSSTAGQSSGRLQVPDPRARSTPVPSVHPTASAPATQAVTQYGELDPHRQTAHVKTPSHDLSSRFPLYEDTATARPSAPGAVQASNASPKRGMTYPGASAPATVSTSHNNPSNHYSNGVYDPRSPKPPSLSTITPDASRLQPYHTGSPAAVAHAVSAGSSANTPKHSPSARLHSHRNGSNDTIAHVAPTRPSPSSSAQQQLPHRTSAVNLHSHASSRPDNTTFRQPNPSSAYPDITRYRSPAPTGYPNAPTSSAPNVAAPIHSQAHSTQTPVTSYDSLHGRASNPNAYAAQIGAPQAYSRSGQSTDYGFRSPDVTSAIPAMSSAAFTSAQRVPPRSAPSPAPTVRPRRLNTVSSPSSKIPAPLHSAPPAPTRNQTYPVSGPNPPPATSFPWAHWRTASDPQYAGRAVGGGYASASLPTSGHGPSRTAPSPTPQADVLLTPSSLAPSMLPQTAPLVPISRTTSKSTTREKEKKKGFFGLNLFRSRSSPPKEREVDAPLLSAAIRQNRERNNSQPSQPQVDIQPSHIPTRPLPSHVAPQVAVAAAVSIPASSQHQHTRGYSTSAVPIAAPTPLAASVSGQRGSNGKMFTPFRLLSRRHHTVSTASVEAVDGTVINAMLTGGDSTRSSTAGRPSPPLRDPMTAAQEWRNNEENEQHGRGTLRRRRPGVTFDIGEEVPEEGRGPIQKTLRQNIQSLQATMAQAPMPTRQATA